MTDEPLRLAETTIAGFQRKADHNKKESLFCFTVVVTFSLASPLFVTLGEGLILGKIVPSVLSLSVAASTAWLQLRKPQNLWSLYRDCQRRIEDSLYKYRYRLAEYDSPEADRSRLLADTVRIVAWEAHQRWLPLVPTPEAIGSSGKPSTLNTIENDAGSKT
jgi:hypothetical protein